MKTNKFILLFAFFMATLSLSAQTTNDEITLTSKDLGLASISKDVYSASINGQIYYYTLVKSNPSYAIIVEKNNAYIKFKEVVLPETFTSEISEKRLLLLE